MGISYRDAGVDVERGYQAVEKMKKHVASTYNQRVLGGLGSFGGFFDVKGLGGDQPVLVSGTDGVGTKLKYAFVLDRHDTIGIDAVAMCVNDIVCQGAKPLFFLDYFATGRLDPEVVATVVAGCAEGCRQAGAALIGGETAEMPSFYADGEYDLAGFSVGIVDRKNIINGSTIKRGDALIGLASSGIHSNGYSLVRKLFGEDRATLLADNRLGCPLADELLRPTKIYVNTILQLAERFDIKGVAHITGGGWLENIPRIFPKGIGGKVDIKSYPVPPIFQLIEKLSGLDSAQLYNTFNMGIGMVLCVDSALADQVISAAQQLGERAYLIGSTIDGEGLCL